MANVLLDEVDKELEYRGHAFVRYADDCNVYVRSRRAGERVLRMLGQQYAKQGVVKPKVAPQALKAMKDRIRQITCRSGGRSIASVIEGLRDYLPGLPAGMEGVLSPGTDSRGLP